MLEKNLQLTDSVYGGDPPSIHQEAFLVVEKHKRFLNVCHRIHYYQQTSY